MEELLALQRTLEAAQAELRSTHIQVAELRADRNRWRVAAQVVEQLRVAALKDLHETREQLAVYTDLEADSMP